MMKLFQVRIDNDPNEWKSGEDPKVIVIAETKEEAIQMVKDGWSSSYSSIIGDNHLSYGYHDNEFISNSASISAIEIRFSMNHIHISNRDSIIDDLIEENDGSE